MSQLNVRVNVRALLRKFLPVRSFRAQLRAIARAGLERWVPSISRQAFPSTREDSLRGPPLASPAIARDENPTRSLLVIGMTKDHLKIIVELNEHLPESRMTTTRQ